MANAILFVVGASGAGKTAAVQALTDRGNWSGQCYFFDSIQIPTPSEMERLYGDGESWQAHTTEQWVEKIVSDPEPLAVLEGQTRPSFIRAALAGHPDVRTEIVLLDCRSDVRRQRLIELRAQPELATTEMDCWSAYLRGQADALGIPVVDTSEQTTESVALQLQQFAMELLEGRSRPIRHFKTAHEF